MGVLRNLTSGSASATHSENSCPSCSAPLPAATSQSMEGSWALQAVARAIP